MPLPYQTLPPSVASYITGDAFDSLARSGLSSVFCTGEGGASLEGESLGRLIDISSPGEVERFRGADLIFDEVREK